MCGFCLSVNDGAVDIHRLTESIKHRGPDSTKYFVGEHVRCGFNRLAIVDDDVRSDQPMVDASGRYLLAFNGEIYNHNELRARLAQRHQAQFVTRSDTEVLLNGLILRGQGVRLEAGWDFCFCVRRSGVARGRTGAGCIRSEAALLLFRGRVACT